MEGSLKNVCLLNILPQTHRYSITFAITSHLSNSFTCNKFTIGARLIIGQPVYVIYVGGHTVIHSWYQIHIPSLECETEH